MLLQSLQSSDVTSVTCGKEMGQRKSKTERNAHDLEHTGMNSFSHKDISHDQLWGSEKHLKKGSAFSYLGVRGEDALCATRRGKQTQKNEVLLFCAIVQQHTNGLDDCGTRV